MNIETEINKFLRYLEIRGVSRKSLKFYKSDIKNFLVWANNKKVTSSLVREYINSEKLTTPTSTLNRRLSTLRSYSNFIQNDFMSGVENQSNYRKKINTLQDSIISKFESKAWISNILKSIFYSRPNWYRKYHSYSITNYIHIAILILFTSLSGYAIYDQVFYSADRSLAFPTNLTRPNRYLSFQGRLTDNLGNPETVATNMVFKLYSVNTGGTALWDSGTCSITPDQDGIFSVLLGSSCGAEIASSVFSENAAVWLGTTMGADAEATPRVQIATVAYALNAETLQGFPAGTGTSTIPYINSAGTLVLANASPKIQSTSGTFAVEGVAMTLSTPNASDGIITINPDGVGTLDLTFEGSAPGLSANGFVNATNANITSGSLYSGTVASNASGYNFINFLSGASPTSKFSIDSTGLTTVGADLYVSSGISLFNNAVSDDTVEASKFCTGDGETNCVTDFSAISAGASYWTRSAGVLSPTTLNDAIAATTSATTAMTITQTGAFDAFLVQDSAGDTTPFVIDQSGNVGIGDVSPASLLTVGSGDLFQVSNTGSLTIPSTTATSELIGVTGSTTGVLGINLSPTVSNATSTLSGIHMNPIVTPTGNVANAYGVRFLGQPSGSSNITNWHNMSLRTTTGAGYTGTLSNANSLRLQSPTISGSIPATTNGVYLEDQGGTGVTTNSAIYIADQISATSNFAIQTNAGNIVFNQGGDASTDFRVEGDTNANLLFVDASTDSVGIGDASPASLFTVGNGDLFQVNSSGDIVKIKNLTYSWPSAHTTNGVLQNNGSGTLTWATLGAAAISADSLDFTEFKDAMTLDTSTDIAVSGTNVLSITNSGTGSTLLVNDSSGDTTPFVIDASGNVGIGTTTPGNPLEIDLATGAGVTGIRIDANGDNTNDPTLTLWGAGGINSKISYDSSLGDLIIENDFVHANGDIIFKTSGASEKVRINGSGNMGIGDTSPASLLTVGNGDLFQVDSSGNMKGVTLALGTGTLAPTDRIYDINTSTALSSVNTYTGTTQRTITGTATGNVNSYNSYNNFTVNGTDGIYSHNAYGAYNTISLSANNTADSLTGIYSLSVVNSSTLSPDTAATATSSAGIRSYAYNNGTGVITAQYGTLTSSYTSNAGTNTSSFGIHAQSYTGVDSSNIGTSYGVYGNSYEFATQSTGGITTGYGGFFQSQDAGTSYGIFSEVLQNTSNVETFTDSYANYSRCRANSANVTMTNCYGVYSDIDELAGTITNGYAGYFNSADALASSYGVYSNVTGASTTNYGIYSNVSGATTNYSGIFNGGNFGIGDTSPASLFTVGNGDLFQINSSGIVTNIDGVAHRIEDVTGNLILTSNSTLVNISDALSVTSNLQVGDATALAYSRFGTSTTAHGLSTADDLLIGSDLEIDGSLYLDGGTIANSAGTATVLFSSTPTSTSNTLTAGNWTIDNSANVGQSALIVNNQKSGDLLTASASGVTKFTVQNDGDVVFSNKLIDSFVTAGISLGATNETALTGFGSTSIVGALNELKNTNKNISHNDYLSWAKNYKAKAEGSSAGINETINGLFFDTFSDSTKIDSVNSTSSGAIRISDDVYRVGLTGGQTYNSSTTDNDGQTYLGSNTVNDIYYYDRNRDSSPEVQVELGIDPNWYNGVTLSVATTSAQYSQSGTLVDKNPNLTTSYNGSLIKVTGTDTSPRTIYITIKSSTTFDWTNYAGDSSTGVTITPGVAQTLGSTGVSATFTSANYNVGDVFKIASWFIEAEGANRGAKQQFPERSYIIGTGSGSGGSYVEIIDADTQKLWMRFSQSGTDGTSNNLLGSTSHTAQSAVSAKNGSVYTTLTTSSGPSLIKIQFFSDYSIGIGTATSSIYNGSISRRNDGLGRTTNETSTVILSTTANDVDVAIIPNQPTQEVTVSGWGFIVGDTTAKVEETVRLPYKFNSTPTIKTNMLGIKTTTSPSGPNDCTTEWGALGGTIASDVTTSTFLMNLHAEGGVTFDSANYHCYSWTATGTVSPKQFVAVATGAASSDGGTTIINETDGGKVDVFIGSQSATTFRQTKVALTSKGDMYLAVDNSTTPRTSLDVYYGIAGIPSSETTIAQYRNGYYGVGDNLGWNGNANGPVVFGSATTGDQIKSLYVSEGTSYVDNTSNTIYVGTTTNLTVINEKKGYANYTGASGSEGNVEGNGSVKYYNKGYISEELIGDIRGMWPASVDGLISGLDVSIKANNTSGTGTPALTSGVRNSAYSLNGSSYLSCNDVNCGGTTKLDSGGTTWSFGAWYKTTGTGGRIINKTNATGGYFLGIGGSGSGIIRAGIYNSTTLTSADDIKTTNDDNWHHAVATYDGAYLRLYIDGYLVSATAQTSTISDTSSDFCIGSSCGTSYFTGSIDEPFVTATTISASQIKNMYQIGYRALQSHGTGLGGGSADTNQQLGYISTGTSSIGVVTTDWNNQYMYIGANSTTLGALSKIQINSDTNIKTYNSSANVPTGGTLLIDEDVTSLGVGYQLEAVGSAASGVKSMSPDSNSTALTGSLFSKTQTLPSATKFGYLWTSFVTDPNDASSGINIYACNNYSTKALCDSNNAWVLGTTIQTDTNQKTPEREYNFAFPNSGSYMTFKFDFSRGSTKTNTYIERFGATWASSTGGADLAERYKSIEAVYPGEILTIESPVKDGEATVGLSKVAYDKKMIGIVTTNPGIVMDENLVDLNFNASSRNSPDRPAVALAGRVYLKVSNKNGAIEVGDPITSSDIAGVGMKATRAGNIIGKALENFTCQEDSPCEGKILVFVNTSWYDPDGSLTDSNGFSIEKQNMEDENGNIISTVYKIVKIAINGTQDIIERVGAFSDLVAGKIRTGSLTANIISPVSDADLIIDLDVDNIASSSSQLAIKGVNDEIVTSFDAFGNATISGTLYANDIESERLNNIESLLSEVENNQQLLADSANWNNNSASISANLEDLVTSNLFVTNNASISSLFVDNNITTKSVDSINGTLSIQSLAIAPLEIMAGKIIIDTNGNTKFTGNIELAGNIKIGGNIVVANNPLPESTVSAEIIEGQTSSNSIAGKAVLKAGLSEIKIVNSQLKDNSLVYITPVSSTQNKVLYVKSKAVGEFTVGFNEAIDTDCEFNWWIIELDTINQ